MTLTQQTVRDYTQLLAGADPTPGGGSAAALVGALAAACGAMVGSFTVGKPKFAAVEDQVAPALERLQTLRLRLLELTDADADAYSQVGAAYGLPRSTDEEKAARREAIQEALKAAAQVPLGVVETVAEVLRQLPPLAEHGNPNLLSDVGCAAILAQAAYAAGGLNVEVNLAGIKDEDYVRAVRERVAGAGQALNLASELSAQVLQRITAK